MYRKIILFFLFICLTTSFSFAEDIYLDSGNKVSGTIVEKTDDYIKVDTGIGIPVTYYTDEILVIQDESLPAPAKAKQKVHSTNLSNTVIERPDPKAPEEIQATGENTIENNVDRKEAVQETLDRYTDAGKQQLKAVKDEVSNIMNKLGGKTPVEESFLDEQTDKTFDQASKDIQKFIQGILDQYPQIPLLFEQIQEEIYTLASDFNIDLEKYGLKIALGLYFLICLPLMFIAKKLYISAPWTMCIPIFQIFTFVKMADKSILWVFIIIFIPILGWFVAPFYLWTRIVYFLHQPTWTVFLTFIPGVNILYLWYLGLTNFMPKKLHKKKTKRI